MTAPGRGVSRTVAAALVAAVLLIVGSGRTSSATAGANPAQPQVPGRLLVLSVPTLAWTDLHEGTTPNLDALVDGAAVGAMSVRDVLPLTDDADAYATVSAGTRARGVTASGDVLGPDEPFRWGTAGEVYEQATGHSFDDGLAAFGVRDIARRNRGLDYDSEPGALGDALAEARVPRAVVANADGLGVRPGRLLERSAGTALMDSRGLVPAGSTSPSLLESSPAAPFGVQLAIAQVDLAFDLAWQSGGVVLVEASDVVRADRYRSDVDDAQAEVLREVALRHTDELVGTLLADVDLARDGVLLVSPYHATGTARLTVAALRAPGIEPGLLESGSTRRSGLVALVDIAPTVLSLVGVDRPESMEGRAFERTADGAATGVERANDLEKIDLASRFRDRMVAPVAVTFVVLQAVLWVAAAVALQRGQAWARRAVATAALAMLAYLPLTYLAGLVAFYDLPAIAYWATVLGGAGLAAVAALLFGRRHATDPLLLVLGVVFGLLLVDMVLGAPLQLNTVFGYSPTVGGRFAGMGNLAFGQFAGAAFLIFGLLTRRSAGRAISVAALAVLVVAVVIDGMPFWGSDVGGVLALVPALGFTAARLLGHRIRWRSAVVWGGAAVSVVGLFAAIDLSRPADERTHLGRLVEAVGDKGFGALETVITRKLGANVGVITSSVWTAMVPIALGFIVYLLWRAPGQIRAIRDSIRECLPGLAIVGVLGFALNDSGIAVPGVMLGVVNASLVYLTVRALPVPGAAGDGVEPT